MSEDDFRFLQQWKDFMVAQGRSPETVRQYHYALLRLGSEIMPAKAITEVTEQDVVVFLASLGKRASAKQLYLRAFKSFFGWAAERGHIEADPAKHLHPKAPSERVPDAFSPEEVGRLMEAARTFPRTGARDALAIQLCYALGLRRSELCRIQPEDVDWGGDRVYIRPSKGDKDRWVEANGLALEALAGLRPWWNGTVVGSMSPQWFTMLVHRAATKAGLPVGRRNAHKLRAAFATDLLNQGVGIHVVQRLLGHSDIATTSRYLGVRAQDKKDAVAQLTRV